MITETATETTSRSTSRRHHVFTAVEAIMMIAWEMNSRFNIGVRNARPSSSEEK